MFQPGEWLAHFLLPLVAGGDVRVGVPPGGGDLDLLLTGPLGEGEVVRRLAEARHAVTAELLFAAAPPELDEAALRIGAACAVLLFLAHPEAAGALTRRGRLRQVARFGEHAAAALPTPTSAEQLCDRHSVLQHLFDLGRDDVRINFWAGRREFHGREPPPRLLAWPTLRRVREERWRVALFQHAVADPLAQPVALALLKASPLTDLLHPERPSPPLDLAVVARWLEDPRIARAVADVYLNAGMETVAGPLGSALEALTGRTGVERAARVAISFTSHLHLLRLVGDAAASPPPPPARGPAPEEAPARDFYGYFAAAERLGLARPRDLSPALAAAVIRYARACVELCGAARVTQLAERLGRAVGRLRPPVKAALPPTTA